MKVTPYFASLAHSGKMSVFTMPLIATPLITLRSNLITSLTHKNALVRTATPEETTDIQIHAAGSVSRRLV